MFNFKKEILLGVASFLAAFLVATTVIVVNNDQYSNFGFLKTAVGDVPTMTSAKFSPSTIGPGENSTLSWESSGADIIKVKCSGGWTYDDYAPTKFSFGPFSYSDWSSKDAKATSVTCTFTPYNTGTPGTAVSVKLTLKAAEVTKPTMTKVEFSPSTIGPGGSSTLSWSSTGADGMKAKCTGAWTFDDVTTISHAGFGPFKYDDLVANGTSVTCTFTPFNGATAGTAVSKTLTLKADTSANTCTLEFTDANNDGVFSQNEIGSFTWKVNAAQNSQVYLACYHPSTVTWPGIASKLEPSQYSGTENDLEFSHPGDYWCVINVFDSAGNIPNKNYGEFTCGDKVTVAEGLKLTPTMTKVEFSPSTIGPGGSSTLSWSSTGADGMKAKCTGAWTFDDVTTISHAGFGPFKYDDLVANGTSVTCTFTPFNGATAGTPVSKTLTLKATTTGACGNGTVDAGEECDPKSIFSGACDRGYTCSSDCVCQQKTTTTPTPKVTPTATPTPTSTPTITPSITPTPTIKITTTPTPTKTPTPTATNNYTPTSKVTVIPTVSYTYSSTTKVAPAAGTATNVALLLSVSAAITVGVWLVMKKMKG